MEPEVLPWAAAVVRIDDRPVTSGNLPDFWQSNLARIVVECLGNPNIRTIVLIRKDADTVKRTTVLLLGACQPQTGLGAATEQALEWSDDKIGQIASATTIRHVQLSHFRERRITLMQVGADSDSALSAASQVILSESQDLSARGEPDPVRWRSDQPIDSAGSEREFKAARLSDVFPKIMRALRHGDTPRYVEPNGDELAEVTGVRVQLDTPTVDDLPVYWAPDRGEFDPYYKRAFAKGSLFGGRFFEWGAESPGGKGVDQVERAIAETAMAVTRKHVSRRIMLVTAQPPGTAPSDPLGLTSVHIFPRFRSATSSWFLDFLWVWRSVEAIVGFPFSAYGSVRFSREFLDSVNCALQGNDQPARLGTVTYLAMSLHLYCAPTDLAIARHIDLEAQA